MSASLNPALRTYIGATREYFGAPSLSLAVVKGDETVFENLGVVEKEGAPVSASTLFHVGDCAWAYVAAAAALLVDKGQLGWEDRVTDHLPEFSVSDPWITQNVTVRDLLAQRLEVSPAPAPGADWRGLSSGPQVTGFRERQCACPQTYLAAMEVVSRISGVPFGTFISENLFRPLGLEQTAWVQGWPDDLSDVARPHSMDAGKLRALDLSNQVEGGLFTSSTDAAAWMRLNLRRGFLGRKPIVKWSSMAEFHTPQVLAEANGRLDEAVAGYGMGWRISNYAEVRMLAHEGHGPGSRPGQKKTKSLTRRQEPSLLSLVGSCDKIDGDYNLVTDRSRVRPLALTDTPGRA